MGEEMYHAIVARTINLYKNHRDLECICYGIRTVQQASPCGQAGAGVPRRRRLQVKIRSEVRRRKAALAFPPKRGRERAPPQRLRAPRCLLVPPRRAARPVGAGGSACPAPRGAEASLCFSGAKRAARGLRWEGWKAAGNAGREGGCGGWAIASSQPDAATPAAFRRGVELLQKGRWSKFHKYTRRHLSTGLIIAGVHGKRSAGLFLSKTAHTKVAT